MDAPSQAQSSGGYIVGDLRMPSAAGLAMIREREHVHSRRAVGPALHAAVHEV